MEERAVNSASTYLQLGEDGEKAAEPRHLAGGTGEGEEVTVLAPTFSWVRMERRQQSRGAWLEGLVEERAVTSASTYLQLGENGKKAAECGAWLEGFEEEGRWQS